MEESQCGSYCHSGCPDLGLCNRLQRLQERSDRGPLSSLQTGMDLILFLLPFHLCLGCLYPHVYRVSRQHNQVLEPKWLFIAFVSDKNTISVILV